MPRRGPAQAAYKRKIHEHLSQGLMNDAKTGKFGPPIAAQQHDCRTFATRASKNRERNARARNQRTAIPEERWAMAVERARAVLRREGDTSEPLPSFIKKFL